MSFETFDINKKPEAPSFNNGWMKLENGSYRKKLSDDCKPFDCEVEVLEATTMMQFIKEDTYEFLVLQLGLCKNGALTDKYLQVKIRGSKVVNGISQLTQRIYNIFALATLQRKDATKSLGNITKYDFNRNEHTHELLNMTGLKFRALIATTGNFNGYCTYTTYLFSPDKRSYDEIQNNDQSLTAFNNAVEKITASRAKFLEENGAGFQQGGYGQNNFGNQEVSKPATTQQKPVKAEQKLRQMQSVEVEPDLNDDLPF